MAKLNTIHPAFRAIEVTATNGDKSTLRSTYHNDTIRLEVDPHTHTAWTKQANYVNEKESTVAKFNQRFSGLNFLAGQK